jgi:hypothetical protein
MISKGSAMNDLPRNPGARYNRLVWGIDIAAYLILRVIGAAAFALAFGWAVMLLWNWLMPAIFRLGAINYWQAFGVVFLAHLIFDSRRLPNFGEVFSYPKWLDSLHTTRDHETRLSILQHFYDFWNGEGHDAFKRYLERRREAEERSHHPPGPRSPGH